MKGMQRPKQIRLTIHNTQYFIYLYTEKAINEESRFLSSNI